MKAILKAALYSAHTQKIHTQAHMHAYTLKHTRVRIRTQAHKFAHTHSSTHVYAYALKYTHVRIHTQAHTLVHTHSSTHISISSYYSIIETILKSCPSTKTTTEKTDSFFKKIGGLLGG